MLMTIENRIYTIYNATSNAHKIPNLNDDLEIGDDISPEEFKWYTSVVWEMKIL